VFLSAGDKFDRYTIEQLLGTGGWGQVYRAVDGRLRRKVALKILNPDRKEEAPRFLREARAAASLHHANVVSIYDMGEVSGIPYIAMELVEGRLLSEFLGPAAGVALAEKVRWLVEVARGIQASHEAGLLHRDIKPQNVIVTKAGSIKLLDFGLAKQTDEAEPVGGPPTRPDFKTRVGFVVGSPRYMPPEALRGGECDGRADQFSWGVTAYELIAGVHPRGGVADPVGQTPPRLLSELVPEVPFPVAAAIARTLAGDRNNRFADMGAVIRALDGTAAAADAAAPTEAVPAVTRAAVPTRVEAPPTVREPPPVMGAPPEQPRMPSEAPVAQRRPAHALAATMQSPQVTASARGGEPKGAAEGPTGTASKEAAERRARTVPRTGRREEAIVVGVPAASNRRQRQLVIAIVAVGVGLGLVAAAWVLQSRSAAPSPRETLPTAPVATATSATDSAAERQGWIVGPLEARVSGSVPMMPARISPSPPYKVNVATEMGFTCTVDFGADGRPSRLSGCTSPEYGFRSPSIALHCAKHPGGEACSGNTGGIETDDPAARGGDDRVTLLHRLR
jgi:serine/threonine-protein kinase